MTGLFRQKESCPPAMSGDRLDRKKRKDTGTGNEENTIEVQGVAFDV